MMFKAIFLVLMGCVSVLTAPGTVGSSRNEQYATESQTAYPDSNGFTIPTTENSELTETIIDDESADSENAIEVIRDTIEDILNRVNDAISNEEFSSIIDELNNFIDKAFPDRNLANHRYS